MNECSEEGWKRTVSRWYSANIEGTEGAYQSSREADPPVLLPKGNATTKAWREISKNTKMSGKAKFRYGDLRRLSRKRFPNPFFPFFLPSFFLPVSFLLPLLSPIHLSIYLVYLFSSHFPSFSSFLPSFSHPILPSLWVYISHCALTSTYYTGYF